MDGCWLLIRVWFCPMGLIFTMAMAVVFGGFFSSGFMGFVGGGVVNFMGFDPDGRGGFFSWWCWVFERERQ